jgi:hypothetical protein
VYQKSHFQQQDSAVKYRCNQIEGIQVDILPLIGGGRDAVEGMPMLKGLLYDLSASTTVRFSYALLVYHDLSIGIIPL